MKTVMRAIQVMVFGACVAAMPAAVSAQTQAGFYVGVGVGESSFDLEKSDFDGAVLDVLFLQGLAVTSGASTFEDSDTSLSLFGGYRFNEYIAVEAGYSDLGTAEYRWAGTVNPPGPIVSAPTTLNIDVESKGFTLAGLGSLPLGEIFDLHGRLGILFATTDLSVTAASGSAIGTDSDQLDSIGGFFSLGAGLNFAGHWSLSLDWTRYDNVSDENDDDDLSTEAGFNVDALSVSAMFRF